MIYVVTGIPRCGKALVMQMLQAGGVELSYDPKYLKESSFNERGFFEYEHPGDKLSDPEFRAKEDGKAINCVSHELVWIPFGARKNMRVIWVKRPFEDTYASSNRTLREGLLGGTDVTLDKGVYMKNTTHMTQVMKQEVRTFDAHMEIWFDQIINYPMESARIFAAFIGKTEFDVISAAGRPSEKLRHFQGGKDA